MKIEIRIYNHCISFGPKINQHEFIQATYGELSLERTFYIPDYCSEQLSKSYLEFKKRMKLK